MLKSLPPDSNLNRMIKVLSTGLITAALGLELGNLTADTFGIAPFADFAIVVWIGRIALVIHAVEGAIAAVCAPSRQRSALKSGTYTFFVGTVGLVELWQLPQKADDHPQS